MDTKEPTAAPQRVTVTDVDISFSSMVGLLVKLAFAAIPAAIIVAILAAIVIAVVGTLFK